MNLSALKPMVSSLTLIYGGLYFWSKLLNQQWLEENRNFVKSNCRDTNADFFQKLPLKL